jgi:hypothetical protein
MRSSLSSWKAGEQLGEERLEPPEECGGALFKRLRGGYNVLERCGDRLYEVGVSAVRRLGFG